MKTIKKQKGFYTLEALIAIIVFIVGILGVLQIQTQSIQTVSDAQYRINAAYLAESIIGQMSVDKANIASYVSGTNPEYVAWLNEVTASLPGVASYQPTIVIGPGIGGRGNIATVTIRWKNNSASIASSYTATTTFGY